MFVHDHTIDAVPAGGRASAGKRLQTQMFADLLPVKLSPTVLPLGTVLGRPIYLGTHGLLLIRYNP